MPRLPRLNVPSGFYHVMLRGNHRADLFTCDADREALNVIVELVIQKLNARVQLTIGFDVLWVARDAPTYPITLVKQP